MTGDPRRRGRGASRLRSFAGAVRQAGLRNIITTLAESTYIDGCGQVCPSCDPEPEWLVRLFAEVEPPF
jgi:hypothetical protein